MEPTEEVLVLEGEELEQLLPSRTSQTEVRVEMVRGPFNNPWARAVVSLDLVEEMERAGWRVCPTT
jgi:hypothetical protein